MTSKQRRLARHALGLPNARGQSYRNHFAATYRPGGDYDHWAEMEAAGHAERARVLTGKGDRKMARFWLTEAGARAALDPGETLCPEDFPHQSS